MSAGRCLVGLMQRGHIRQRGGSFEVRAYAGVDSATGKDRYVTKTVRGTRKDAERELTQLLADLDNGRIVAAPRRTFAEAATKWLEMATPDMSPGTVVTTQDFLRRYLFPAFGHVPVARIQTEDLDALYGRLRRQGPSGRPLSASTIRRVHGIAHRVFEQARRWHWRSDNPAADATPPPVPKRRPTAPTPDEVAAFVQWVGARDADFALYLRLAAITGSRRGELCALRWTALDLDAGTVAIDHRLVAGRSEDGHEVIHEMSGTKRNAGHDVALDPATISMLRGHRRACQQSALACGVPFLSNGFVFSLEPDGREGWRPHSVTQRFRRLRQRAGLPNTVRLHDLRHHVASHLLDQGVPITTVAERVGHGSADTTLGIYGHGTSEADRRAAEILAAVFDPKVK